MKTETDASPKCIRTSVSVPAEDYKEIERLSQRKKVSVAWIIREAIEKYLNAESPLFRERG